MPSIIPAGRKNTTKPVLRRTNLTAEKTALVNPSKLSNRAFLTLDRRSSSPELRIQHAEHSDDHLNSTRTFSSPHMSPSIGDHHDRPTSPSSGVISPSRTTSVARTQTKKVAKSVAKFQQGVVIGKRPKASDYEEVVAALLVRAMFDYEGLVSTHDAFPDLSLRRQWTLRCWKQALKDADEQIEISERMMSLVCNLSLLSTLSSFTTVLI